MRNLIIASSFGIFLLSISFYGSIKAFDSKYLDTYTLVSEKNFFKDFKPVNPDGTINAVIEIPTGTTAKREVDKADGSINGMIPQTLLSEELGGDGDPLDIIVLGPAVPRGSVVRVKLIGVLKLLDEGEQDDKLIAVLEGTSFYDISNIEEFNQKFNGVDSIIETWFTNYKGPGKLQSQGFANLDEAKKVLYQAIDAYKD